MEILSSKLSAVVTAFALGATMLAGCTIEHRETIDRTEPVTVLDHRYEDEYTTTETHSCGEDCEYTTTTYHPPEYYLTVQQCDKPPAVNVSNDGYGCVNEELNVTERQYEHEAGETFILGR